LIHADADDATVAALERLGHKVKRSKGALWAPSVIRIDSTETSKPPAMTVGPARGGVLKDVGRLQPMHPAALQQPGCFSQSTPGMA